MRLKEKGERTTWSQLVTARKRGWDTFIVRGCTDSRVEVAMPARCYG